MVFVTRLALGLSELWSAIFDFSLYEEGFCVKYFFQAPLTVEAPAQTTESDQDSRRVPRESSTKPMNTGDSRHLSSAILTNLRPPLPLRRRLGPEKDSHSLLGAFAASHDWTCESLWCFETTTLNSHLASTTPKIPNGDSDTCSTGSFEVANCKMRQATSFHFLNAPLSSSTCRSDMLRESTRKRRAISAATQV